MNIKTILIYLISIIFPIGAGLLLSFVFTGDAKAYYIMFTLGIILLSIIVTYFVSQKLDITIDIYASNHSDSKTSILNNIMTGLLFAIPICIFFSLII